MGKKSCLIFLTKTVDRYSVFVLYCVKSKTRSYIRDTHDANCLYIHILLLLLQRCCVLFIYSYILCVRKDICEYYNIILIFFIHFI